MPLQPFDQTQKERQTGRTDFRDLKKHYVRVKGWLPAFRTYSRATGGRVQYLTFCAKEAIDVRYFAQKGVLVRNDERNDYPSLTFVESDEEDYAIIAETLGRVRLALHADFETVLLDGAHPRHQDLVASFPYHVVNLDFCGHIVPRKKHPYNETIRCIDKIVELQAGAHAPGWHLFLTFRAQRAHANEEANGQLSDIVNENLGHEEFKQAYGERPAPVELLGESYPEFLRVSVAKVLAHTARNHGYALAVESSWVYSRQGGTYHIVKLVAALKPLAAATALRNPTREQTAYDVAVKAIFSSHATDVDAAIEAAKQEIEEELKPVLEELEKLGIVTT
jgi:hypothetical protein